MLTTLPAIPLAHAGAGASWQALLSLVALGLLLVVVLVAAGVVNLSTPGDLVLPLASVAVVSSLSGAATGVLSDWVWWAFPIGVVALLVLAIAATTSLRLALVSPLFLAAAAASVLSVVAFDDPITRAWHPQPLAIEIQNYPVGDLDIEITSPLEGASVSAGTLEVVVEVTNGSIGMGPTQDEFGADATLLDPGERGYLQVFLDGVALQEDSGDPLRPIESCEDGCTTATYRIPDVETGVHRVIVEFKARDRNNFTPALFRQVQVDVP